MLDSIKHQLRYYDSMDDSSCKGVIELADVVSVSPGTSAGSGGGDDDKTFFEVVPLSRRRKRNGNDAFLLFWFWFCFVLFFFRLLLVPRSFQVKTQRRTYNFGANDVAAAQEWIEKIQSCLQ